MFCIFQLNREKLPYWKMTLLNVCSLINNINNQPEETAESEEDDLLLRGQFPAALDGSSLEAMLTIYQLQKVCHSRAFQHWEVSNTSLMHVTGKTLMLYLYFKRDLKT